MGRTLCELEGRRVDLGPCSKPACTLKVSSRMGFGRTSEKSTSWWDIWVDLDLGLSLREHSKCPAVCYLGGPVRNLIAGGISGVSKDKAQL